MRQPFPSAAANTEWLTSGRFTAILALMLFAAWPQVFLGAGTFVYRDFGYFTYPVAQFQRECFWRGELPLWNPYNCTGIPFLAQWNTAALYPPSLFYLLLPLSWSLGVFQLLHLLLGGMGMFFLARQWTGNSFAAAVTGVIFAFNGLTANCLMWVSNLAALMWMPWVLWASGHAVRDGGKKFLAAVLIGALQMLTGSPEIILLTWVLNVPIAIASGGKGCARLAMVVLLVAGLAAAQLLPFLDLLAHSQRDEHYATGLWAMPLYGWANFFLPLFHARPSAHGVFLLAEQGWTSSYYVGLFTIALAFLALLRVRSSYIWWLATAALIGIVLAFGDAAGIYGWLRRNLMGFGWVRYPIKFVVLPVFALPLLAAYALAECQTKTASEKLSRRLLRIWLVLIAIVGAFLWIAHSRPLPEDVWPATLYNGLARVAWLTAALIALVVAVQNQRVEFRFAAQMALLLFVWLDLQTHAPRQQTIARKNYESRLARTSRLPQLGEGRVMNSPASLTELKYSYIPDSTKNYISRRWTLMHDCNLLETVPKVDGFFSLHVREEIEAGSQLLGDTNTFPAPLADFLGVKVITSPTNIFDWTSRDTALPLVTAGQKPVFADAKTTLARIGIEDSTPATEVFLPLEARTAISATNTTPVKILNPKFTATKVEFETDSTLPAMVVIAQTYYHWWRADVDGEVTQLWRANHAYQALQVPAGRHRVTLIYDDRSFLMGSVISLVSLVVCVVLGGRWRRRFFGLG